VEAYLQKLGATVEVLETLPEFEESLEIWSASLSKAGSDDFAFLMGNLTHSVSGLWELTKWLFDCPAHTFPAIGLSIIEKVPKLFPARTNQDAAKGLQVKKVIEQKLGPNGVILYPTYPHVAPRHNKPLLPPFNWVYTAIFNVLQFPVTQVPLGLNKHGIPLGIQVASIPGNDTVTIGIGLELEKAFGGWKPPVKMN